MTLVWLTLAFLSGCAFWHWFGNKMVRRLAWHDNMRADLIKNLSTDLLIALRRDASSELERRANATKAAGL